MKNARVRDNVGKENPMSDPRILIVIEEPESLVCHSNLLQSLGYRVFACGSYSEGFAILQREAFDLITIGQGGKAFEGKKLVTRALGLDRSTPVLVLARNSDINNYLEAMQLGAVDYLEMPVPREEFARVLRTHLRYRPAA